MTFKMKNMAYWKAKNGLPGINHDFEKDGNMPDGRSKSSPFQKNKKDGAPIAPKSKIDKDRNESIEYINDAEDQLEWLNEDLFNEKISKAQYDAKAKLLNMKIDAGRKAVGFDKMTKKDLRKEGPVKNKEDRKRSRKIKREKRKLSRAYKRQEKKAGGPNIDEID